MESKQNSEVVETKTIGGPIPKDLYWQFKSIQAIRQETSTKALEIAIRLYCDAVPTQESKVQKKKEEEHLGSE